MQIFQFTRIPFYDHVWMMQMQKTNILINFVSLSAFPHNTSTFEVLLILFLLFLSLSLSLSLYLSIYSSLYLSFFFYISLTVLFYVYMAISYICLANTFWNLNLKLTLIRALWWLQDVCICIDNYIQHRVTL